MALLKDTRGFRPFRSSEEYLYAMKEDLAEWLNMLYPHLHVTVDTFIHRLETGVVLCEHANAVYAKAQAAADAGLLASLHPRHAWKARVYHGGPVRHFPVAKAGTFFARDNVSNFITWCRNDLQVLECLLFETEDLILMKNEKNVILCLLEVARRGARLGMLAPMLIQLEQEIDREIARDQRAAAAASGLQDGYEDDVDDDDLADLETEQALKEFGPMPQIVTNDLKSLDDMVRDLVARCSCPVQFPMIRVSEGKYRIGDTKVLIFVRVLRSHVMVRVGGGWDTLSHYLDKHDPCRCKTSHRSPLSAKLILKNTGAIELDTAKVMYERSPPRTRRSSASSVGSNSGINTTNSPSTTVPSTTLTPASNNTNTNSGTRSRSTTPRRASTNQTPQSSTALNVTDNRTRSKSPAKGIERRSMRTRSKSPAVHPNNTPNTSSNIHRSRSPNRKVEEPAQIAQQTPTINIQSTPSNTKVFEDRSSPILDQNTTTEENKEPSTDSGSEISDEGYRSLPINLQSTPNHQVVAVQPTATAQTDEETISLNQIDDDEDETIRITTTEEGTLVQIFPKTIEQPIPQEEVVIVDPPEMQEPPKEVHRFASLGMSPRRIPLSPSPSNVSVQNASPRKGSLAPSSRSMSIEAMDGCVSKKSNSRSSNYGTWTSRTSKQRPTINAETFTRNSPQRRSLGASPIKKQSSLPSSLQTSPTKQISAILDEQLRHTEDRSTLLEIKQMILQYQHIVEERLEQVNQESGTPSSGPSSLPPIISSSITWTPRTASTGNNKTRSRIPAPTMASIRRPSSAID